MSSRPDPFKGIKVEVISEGISLDLYDDPEAAEDGEHDDLRTRNQYVQATAGAKFEVRVVIGPDFDLYDPHNGYEVRGVVKFDGQGIGTTRRISSADIRRNRATNVASTLTFKQSWEYCEVSQQWKKGYLGFAALAVTEERESITDLHSKPIKHLGSFDIRIQRIYLQRRQSNSPYRPLEAKPITSVPEKLLKGRAVATVTRIQDSKVMQPRGPRHDHIPLTGEKGRELHFCIRYRSKQTLQAMGCVPRTPSPELDLAEENRRLRERVAALEGSAHAAEGIKAESSQRNGIKRERGAFLSENDRKRVRESEIAVVDLTDE